MKILVFGAGIIGCTYAWQLSEAGHDVSILVRKGKKQILEKQGISFNCTDFRGNTKIQSRTIFRPPIIDELSSDNDYEFIIVSVNSTQLKSVLPFLAEKAGNANILFFQNNWSGSDEIDAYLTPEQYLFGFPSITGGGRVGNEIVNVICGIKFASTMLGEKNGKITPRLERLAQAINDAHLKPKISKQIIPWLISHYAMIAALLSGIIKAGGSTKRFTSDYALMRETIFAIREGFEVCRTKGVHSEKIMPSVLFYLPLLICRPIVKSIYSREELTLIFDGHLRHSPNEMKQMYYDVLETGKQHGIQMPYLKRFQKFVDEYKM